jgi:APA family basic amino acid/polyamine antiporter
MKMGKTAMVEIPRGELRRELNLLLLVFMGIGLNIGGALFSLTGIVAGLTGPSLPISQILSALPVLFSLIPYMTLASAIPTTCGSYRYAKLFSRPLAVIGWLVLIVGVGLGGMPLYAITTVRYLQVLIPDIPLIGTAVGILTLFYVINLLGIKPTALVQFGMTACLLLALAVFVILGAPAIKIENFTPLFAGGPMGFLVSSALLFTLLAGGLYIIDVGEETKEAESTMPRALLISIIITLAFYLAVEVVAVGVLNWKEFAGRTLAVPAMAFLPGLLLYFFAVGGGVLACVTTIHGIMTLGGRYFLVFAEDGFLPSFFGRINKKFGTPHWGLTLGYVLTVIGSFFISSLEVMGLMLNFGLIFMITLVDLAAYSLPKRRPEIYEKAEFRPKERILKVTSLVAVVLNVFLMALLAIAMRWAFIVFVAVALLGLGVYYLVLRRKRTSSP